ncbi:MAG TPA: type IV toxin-antitoxin system AbiEi family antitoxin domain-containing protein [Sphingobium sp.]|uniref:type IV toxin-antitoxin system AbiEi family antitoxin domain-containing protein n=1 Tax=Sphingobium sp. TaxID=1912891 RepID=UPI002ED170A5
MHYRRGLLGKLKASDRTAVTLLRGGGAAGATPEMCAAFATLRTRLGEAGQLVLPVDAQTMSQSELFVLGWLAALQRNRLESAIETRRIDAPEAQLCARLLDQAGHRLDYHHVVRITDGDELFAHGSTAESPRDPVWPLADTISGGTLLRHRIIRELTDKGPMPLAELTKLGASRQTISNMAKRGLLKRVRFGVYAISE